MVSPGYGIGHTDYSFIASALADQGYLTVAIQHELPSDPPLPTRGDLFAARTPAWRRGAQNLRFVHDTLQRSYPGFAWDRLVLIGHSNGGDIAAWLARESPGFASTLITLDNRRMPLPRSAPPRVLSIRAGDFAADAGVLPHKQTLAASGSCIIKIDDARHNDMHDGGPAALRDAIVQDISHFLGQGECGNGGAPDAGS